MENPIFNSYVKSPEGRLVEITTLGERLDLRWMFFDVWMVYAGVVSNRSLFCGCQKKTENQVVSRSITRYHKLQQYVLIVCFWVEV